MSVTAPPPPQSLIRLDEATIDNPSHVYGFFSVFDGDAMVGVLAGRLAGAGPVFDSLYVLFRSASSAAGDSGFHAVIDYTDATEVPNYYLREMFVDRQRVVAIDPGNQWRVISRDRFYDGQKVTGYLPLDEQVVLPGQFIQLRQLAITEEAYRYYFACYDQATGGGSPFSTPPSSVRGNVQNLTRPEHRAQGFLLAAEARRRTLVVPQP